MKLSKIQANVVLLICAFIWGVSFTFIKAATNAHVPIGLLNGLRGLLFALLVYVFFPKIINHMTRNDLIYGTIGGILYFIVTQLQSTGLKYTTPSNSAFLTATYVIFVPFISWLLFKQRPSRRVYVAVILCVIGMVFLTGIINSGLHVTLGDGLTLLSAVTVAFDIIYLSIVAMKANPIRMSFMLGVVMSILGLGSSILFERSGYTAIQYQDAIWPIIYLGVFASFIAQTLQIFSQKFTDPTSVGMTLMTESLFASIFSVSVGVEKLTRNLVIGGALIFIALILMQIRFKKNAIH